MTNATMTAHAVSDNYVPAMQQPTIGQLLLLPSSHIKPNQPLVHNETGEIEIVNRDKYFDVEDYSRYYLVTDEEPSENNLVFVFNSDSNDAQICMYREDLRELEGFDIHVCYPAANSIVQRLHTMYHESLAQGCIEYLRFTKIHNGKYAGFPSRTLNRIPATQAKERWDYIFQHVLLTNPTNIRKKRIGILFGTIAGVDLTLKATINTLNKYKDWILS